MTKEEILIMRPGADLNAKIAEEVMGRVIVVDPFLGALEQLLVDRDSVWGTPEPYSEDRVVAETVVERMRDLGYQDAVYWSRFGQGQYTEAEAICKAALLSNLSGKAECTQ